MLTHHIMEIGTINSENYLFSKIRKRGYYTERGWQKHE